jgi:hypothetical protein
MKTVFTFLFLIALMQLKAQEQIKYQEPPREIYDLIMAKPVPSASIDDAGK